MTAKGLEPHLIRIYADHQAALEEARQTYHRQLSDAVAAEEEKHRAALVPSIQAELRGRYIEDQDREVTRLQALHAAQVSALTDDHQKELRRVTEYWKDRVEQTETNHMVDRDALRKQLTDAFNRETEQLTTELKAVKSAWQDTVAEITAKCEREKEAWIQQKLESLAEQQRQERSEVHSHEEQKYRQELELMVHKLAQEQATLVSRLEDRYERQLADLRGQVEAGNSELRASLPALAIEGEKRRNKGKKPAPVLSTETPTLRVKAGKREKD